MISRQQFIKKLREMGYAHKVDRKKVSMWRRTGGTHIVPLPHTKFLSETSVTSILRQCGSLESEIEEFLLASTAEAIPHSKK